MTLVNLVILLFALAAILIVLQWVMYCQAKRSEGEKAPDTSAVNNQDNHSLRVYYFFSQTCGPCRRVRPMVDKLCEDHSNLIKVDIAEHSQLARDFGLAGVPSFIVVEDGVIKNARLGRVSKGWLLKWLTE